MVSKAAQELGRKGGQARSERKTAAVRENAKKSRGKWVTALYYTAHTTGATVGVVQGLVMCKGNLTQEQERYKAQEHLLIMHKVSEEEIHAIGWESCRIKV